MDYFDPRDNVCMYEEGINNFVGIQTDSEIQNFYENKNVLITGATGLIGRSLVERLLRSCPKLSKIYLLMSPNKNEEATERLEEFSFPEVNKVQKDAMAKTKIIYGDCAQPWCGISEYDQQILIDNIHVVYHSEATTGKTENLRNSYYTNIRATQCLLELATKMKHIKAFIYVSTVYTHAFLADMKENFYETTFSESDLRFLEENLDDEQLTALSPRIVGLRENNYGFTKAVAEGVVRRYLQKIPIAIVRPSIVISCDKEATIKWINYSNKATRVKIGFLGLMTAWRHGAKTNANIIPADKVVSTMVAISWQVGTHTSNGNKSATPVYNVVSSTKLSINWRECMHYIIEDLALFCQPTFSCCLAEYKICIREYKLMYSKLKILKLFNELKKIHKFNKYLENYHTRDWLCERKNVNKLWLLMSDTDKKLFDFNMSNYDWKQFISRSAMSSMACFLMKDSSDVETTLKKCNRCQQIRNFLKIIIYGIIVFSMKGYLLSLLKCVNTVFL